MEAKPHFLLRFFRKTDLVFDRISKICAFISGTLLVGIALIVCGGIFSRSFTDWKWLFVEEYGGLFLVPASYVAFGYALRQGRHFKVDILIRKLSKKKQNIMAAFSAIFSLICLYYMIQFAMDRLSYTVIHSVVSPGPMRTPTAPFAACMLFGICLFMVDMLCFLIHRILEMRQNGGAEHVA